MAAMLVEESERFLINSFCSSTRRGEEQNREEGEKGKLGVGRIEMDEEIISSNI